jgi:hypothetical protein
MPLDNTNVRPLATNAKPAATKSEVALDYHHARVAATAAESKKKKTTAEAVKSGVIFDHAADPEEPGTDRQVYDDGAVRITVKVAEPIEKLDVPAFLAGLVAAKVPPATIKRLKDRHTVKLPAAHSFSSSLVG